MFVRDKLSKWLKRELETLNDDGLVVKLELCHLPMESKRGGARVRQWEVPNDVDFLSMAMEVESEALLDAAGMGHIQKYVLYTYREKSKKEVSARVTFAIDGQSEPDVNGSEPPNMTGLTSQLMRHTEALTKIVTQLSTQNNANMGSLMARLAEQYNAQLDKRLESVAIMEDLLSQRHERELEAEEARSKSRSMQELASGVKALLPAIAANATGDKSGALLKQQVSSLFNSLDEEKRDQLISGLLSSFNELDLSPAQQAAAGKLFEALVGATN